MRISLNVSLSPVVERNTFDIAFARAAISYSKTSGPLGRDTVGPTKSYASSMRGYVNRLTVCSGVRCAAGSTPRLSFQVRVSYAECAKVSCDIVAELFIHSRVANGQVQAHIAVWPIPQFAFLMLPLCPLVGTAGSGRFAKVLPRLPAVIKLRGKPLKSRAIPLSSRYSRSSGNS